MIQDNPWLQMMQQFQQTAVRQWTELLHNQPQGSPLQALGFPGEGNLDDLFAKITGGKCEIEPSRLNEIQTQYLQELSALWQQGSRIKPPEDRRFAGEAWQDNPLSAFAAALYLLNARTLMTMADAVEGDAKTKARIHFAVQQWIDASDPSNFFALNADAQQKALETGGDSLSQGMQNLLKDMQRGQISMTDHDAFEVGRNLATTEGQVVFENALFQLIEYKPLTDTVCERPLLLVPPCINKYYILDLQPDNSLIRYAVEQGMRTFVMSWRNPGPACAGKTWDDYIGGAVIEAIRVTREIAGVEAINALGFCVGGTMLGCALAVLAARGERPVHSATFLTTLLDFSDTGVLDVFIDEEFVKFREMQFANGGLLPGRELALTFNYLRPRDLVWNFVVGNYLKGEKPRAFDLLYWNADSTNLPGPYYAWYLRNTYLENRLIKPGAVTVCGEKIDLSQIDLPIYVYGSRDDHIVPVGGAYASVHQLPGPKRFVMGASGHIAGVINPPSKGKRCYWTRDQDDFPVSVGDWIAGANEHPGSWWADWADWLKGQSGEMKPAPKRPGNRKYKPIEPAPGRYVKVRDTEAAAEEV